LENPRITLAVRAAAAFPRFRRRCRRFASELDQNVGNGVKTPNVMPDIISKRLIGYGL
jgi:hypothetical protein